MTPTKANAVRKHGAGGATQNNFNSNHTLLDRLDKVRQTGSGRYLALCPAHDDKSPSLAIRELDDGRVLVHCFAGCDVESILGAIGLDMGDLYPPRETEHAKPEKRPFPAVDILRAIAFEALVVVAAAGALLSGELFAVEDRERLAVAVGRIQAALDAGGLQ